MHAGIDEAGRGPVLGPLVVAGVAVPDDHPLQGMGVRDSKRLSPLQRQRIARLIPRIPDVRVAVETMDPGELDARRAGESLNDIEVDLFTRVAVSLGVEHIIVDAADVDAVRFGRRVAAGLDPAWHVTSEHGADDRHPAVGAASIMAKVARDDAVAELARRLERKLAMPLGSGYPGDARTQAFLKAYVTAHQALPEGCRRTWATARHLMAAAQTARLDTF